jgi:hypothetical protein
MSTNYLSISTNPETDSIQAANKETVLITNQNAKQATNKGNKTISVICDMLQHEYQPNIT